MGEEQEYDLSSRGVRINESLQPNGGKRWRSWAFDHRKRRAAEYL